jgi:PAS domain S-box-containing protein
VNFGPILVVDDDNVSRHVIGQALTAAGFDCVSVASGTAALEKLATLTPKVVLLDLVMPPPDGYHLLRILRAREATRDVPVLVLTARDAEDEIARAFEAGADDFVKKPFKASELVARVRSQLRLRKALDGLAQRERDAQVVLELTQALASNLDFRGILFTVVQRIAAVAKVDRVSIVLVRENPNQERSRERNRAVADVARGGEPARTSSKPPSGVGYVVAASDDEHLRDLPIDLTRYPEILDVLSRAEPLIIDDAHTHPIFDLLATGTLPPTPFRTLAILPILYEGRAMGVLFLRARRTKAVGDRELYLARTVASAMAIALRNARVLQTLRDQTQEVAVARFEAERRLKNLQKYAEFFENSADGIAVFDSEGRLLFSNPTARQITGYAQGTGGPNLPDGLIPREDRAGLASLLSGFARGEFPKGIDVRLRAYDGSTLVVSASFSSVLREDGAILVSFRDVTQERAVELELVKTKESLQRVIDASADAIVAADLSGKITIFNRAAERLFLRKSVDVISTPLETLYPEEGAAKMMRAITGAGGRIDGTRTEILDGSGSQVPVAFSGSFLYEGDVATGSVGIYTDLREKMRMEQRLQQAQAQLLAQERQAIVAELAGAAAHELNQPLTSVIAYAEMLRRRIDEGSPAHEAARVIAAEAERMAEIVRKIGKITRYETKSYVGTQKILDLDKASGDASVREAGDGAENSAPASVREAGDSAENSAPASVREAGDGAENSAPASVREAGDGAENSAPASVREAETLSSGLVETSEVPAVSPSELKEEP